MEASTQIVAARTGHLTEEMRLVAEREFLAPELVRENVAAGRVVIPANHRHASLKPIGIGKSLRTKINANIGNSSLSSGPEEELEKLRCAIRYGADTVMDLSTGDHIDEIRRRIIAESTVPLGTVPIYEAVAKVHDPLQLTGDLLLEVIERQASQGVDYMTVHAGVLREQVPLALERVLGIVSRGGAMLARWMEAHGNENPLYKRFDDLLDICRIYDVTLSLGDGMRPGCLADASDAAQFAELSVLGELIRRCRDAGVQAMVEGPGHIPLDQIEMNMIKEEEICDGAPFYVLGPVVTDCAPGYDHITAAIGGTLAAYYGAAMLCYVTPMEHLGLPDSHAVREGVVASRIAAHAADIARGRPGARDRDDEISRARAVFDWDRQFRSALDPERARCMHDETRETARSADCESHCTMCGPDFCSMRISRDLKQSRV